MIIIYYYCMVIWVPELIILFITGAHPNMIPTITSGGICQKDIRALPVVRHSVEDARGGVDGSPKRGSPGGNEG